MSARRLLALLLLLAVAAQGVRAFHRMRGTRVTGAVRDQVTVARASGGLHPALVRAALVALERARDDDPAAVEPRVFRGDLLLLAGRPAEAEAAYRESIAHEPRAEAMLHLGLALDAQGRRSEALVHWRRAVAVAPPLATALPPGVAAGLDSTPLRPLAPGEATRRAR